MKNTGRKPSLKSKPEEPKADYEKELVDVLLKAYPNPVSYEKLFQHFGHGRFWRELAKLMITGWVTFIRADNAFQFSYKLTEFGKNERRTKD